MNGQDTTDEKELVYELGRYKKAVTVRDELIKELREDMAGQLQIIEILSAYIAILAGEEEREMGIKEISEAIGSYGVKLTENKEKACFVIKAFKKP